jgi:hypothetical protein
MEGHHFIRRNLQYFTSILLFLAFITPSKGQNVLEDVIEQLSSDNVTGYIQPMVDSFGANINSGFPGSARIQRLGLTVRLQFIGMATLIGDAEKTYMAMAPEPFSQQPVKTATIFGDQGASVQHPGGIEYQFQNGQIKTRYLPFAIPQLTVGDLFGTQLSIRFVPGSLVSDRIEDFPEISLFGVGVRHSVSQYLPLFPVDVAVGGFYQTFSIGDYFDSEATAFFARVSKSFVLLTVYGGLQYETTDVTLSYTYTGPLPPGDQSDRNISLALKGENEFRATAGVGLGLGVLHLNADISVGKVIVASVGIGFGI